MESVFRGLTPRTPANVVNNWSKTSQAHQLRWGVDFRRYQFNFESVNSSSRGNYTFCQTGTGDPSDTNSGLGMATFLLGNTCTFDRAIFTGMPAERQTNLGLYIQDIWRISPRLTLNWRPPVGLFHACHFSVQGRFGQLRFQHGKYSPRGRVGKRILDSANVTTPKNDFAPRSWGIAYKITKNTVIRAGFGRSFFSSGYDATFYHLTSGYPIVTQQSVTQPNLYQSVFDISNDPPAAAPPSLPSSGILKAPDGVTLKSREFNWKTETMDSWNFTIEQSLGSGATLSIAYVGNKGTHLNWGENLNAANVGDADLQDRRPYYLAYGLTQAVSLQCNCSDSNYNALDIVLNKQLSRFYTVVSNFSWSKAMGYGFDWSANTYNRGLDYGPGGGTIGSGDMDRKFVWITMHSFNIPYGPGRPFGSTATGARSPSGGWVFSGITSVESGLAYTPLVSSSASLNADFTQRPSVVAGVSPNSVPGGKSAALWYNPAAFVVPTCCQFGNASVGSLRGPHLINADWALSKDFIFGSFLNRENTKVQVRAEGFNLWNNANLGLPNANVDASSAGQITALLAPMRRMEFGLHIMW